MKRGLFKQYTLLKHKNRHSAERVWSLHRAGVGQGVLISRRVASLRLRSIGIRVSPPGPLTWGPVPAYFIGSTVFFIRGTVFTGSWASRVSSFLAHPLPLVYLLPHFACLSTFAYIRVRVLPVLRAVWA